MNGPMLVQSVVIALALAWAVWFAFRRLLPKTYRRLSSRVLGALDRPPSPRWLREAARHAQPTSTSGGSCGDGCSSCGGCATASAKPAVEAQPLVFRPRAPK
ncbi:DUF6587 family protein [Dokdonella sp.]|uniref:DUF6587 family protein n=1 Tax=Dokdonella sp. TaxID=2291710 RepID=UPI0026045322|nr:DUF6587 family protein [Dokdonella sp.]